MERKAALLLRFLPLILTAAVVLFLLRSLIMDALGVLFGACLIAFLLAPLAALFEKKLSRTPAVLISMALAGAALAGVIWLIVPLLGRQLGAVIAGLPDALSRLLPLGERLMQAVEAALPGLSLPMPRMGALQDGLAEAARSTGAIVSGFAAGVYRAAISLVLGYFLLRERERTLLRLELMLPLSLRRDGVRLGRTILTELRLYLRGQALVSLGVGSLSALALSLIGLDGALLLGLIVGLFNMIPYFGPLIGSIPAVLAALGQGWQKAALTAGALLLVQQIDSLLLSPRIMGSITGFSPAIVLVAIYLGSRIGGVAGLLLAVPLLMCLRSSYRVFATRNERA